MLLLSMESLIESSVLQQTNSTNLNRQIHGEQMILTIVAMNLMKVFKNHISQTVWLWVLIFISNLKNKKLPFASKKYQIPVMMSNSNGITTRFECVGNSAVWNNGVLLNQLSKDSESILFFFQNLII